MAKTDQVVWCDRGWQPVAYGFVPSQKAWDRQMKRMGREGEYATKAGHCHYFEGTDKHEPTILVTCECGYGPIEKIGVLIHEAVHVWQFICDHIGEESPGMEQEAYAIQTISQNLIDAYCKTRAPLLAAAD